MSIEITLENDIVEYLGKGLPDLVVEAFAGDLEQAIQKAVGKRGGVIYVSHSTDFAEYGARSTKFYPINLPFTITMFNSDRRGHDGIYNLLSRVREAMLDYSFRSFHPVFKGHRVSNSKYNGIFPADLDLEFKLPSNIMDEKYGN